MNFLSKTWARVIISLFGGGLTSELLFITSGDPYRHRSGSEPNFSLLYALIIYIILTAFVRKYGKQKFLSSKDGLYSRPVIYVLDPEVPGELGEKTVLDTSVHPPIVSYLHLIFKGWMGDDLLKCFPIYMVAERLSTELGVSDLTGFELHKCLVESSEEFEVLQPGINLPNLSWLHITGTKEISDFYFNDEHKLTVSENAYALLNKFNLKFCDIIKE